STLDRAVASGLLVRVQRGIVRLALAPRSRESRLWAALLWAGDGAVLSHDSAGRLWNLEGLPRELPAEIDVTVPLGNKASSLPAVRVHRTRVLTAVKDFATLSGFS